MPMGAAYPRASASRLITSSASGPAARPIARPDRHPPPTPPPRALEEVARVVGVFEDRAEQDPGVVANARLTGTTGLLLIVLFFCEGVTIPFISRILSWHIVIGLILIPPVLLKIGSTLWRFAHYYLGDPRFRKAGPPHPLLRVLGPLVMLSTVAVIGSGVALWLAGPHDLLLLRIHQVTFVLWFAVVAVHVVAHVLRATRLAAADSRDAAARNPKVAGARTRRLVVAGSLVAGLAVGALGMTVTTPWSHNSGPVAPAKTTTVKPGSGVAGHAGGSSSPAATRTVTAHTSGSGSPKH